jgi:hypothetical protein
LPSFSLAPQWTLLARGLQTSAPTKRSTISKKQGSRDEDLQLFGV